MLLFLLTFGKFTLKPDRSPIVCEQCKAVSVLNTCDRGQQYSCQKGKPPRKNRTFALKNDKEAHSATSSQLQYLTNIFNTQILQLRQAHKQVKALEQAVRFRG